jgi:hypothetical protein
MTSADDRVRSSPLSPIAPPARRLPRGVLEAGVRLASSLLVLALALALIGIPGLPAFAAGETEELRRARIGAGVALLVILLALQIFSPWRRRAREG